MNTVTIQRHPWLILLVLLLLLPLATPLYAQGDDAEAEATPPPLPHILIGDIYADADMPAEAAGFYLKALEANPADQAALAKLRAVLTEDETDPRIAVADAYVAAGDYASALALYTEILQTEPDQPAVQARAVEAATETTRLNGAWWGALGRDWLGGVVRALATALGVVVLLLILLGLAQLVRTIREAVTCTEGRLFIIAPFLNATGSASLKGMENGARSAVVDWLVTRKQAVQDEADQVEEAMFPELGAAGKLLNWIVTLLKPRCPQLIAGATLLHYPSRQEAVLALTVQAQPNGPIVRSRTFTLPGVVAGDELAAFVDLAHQSASWLLDEPRTVDPAAATVLHEAHQLAVQAQASARVGRKADARRTYARAAERARTASSAALGEAKTPIGAASEAAVHEAAQPRADDDLASATADRFDELAAQLQP